MKISDSGRYNSVQIKQQNLKTKEKGYNRNGQESFKGGPVDAAFNVVDKFFSVLDKNAMIQVSFVDTVSTNIPRTLVDLGTGLAAAFETCRREFSGLFVNCLMPGLLVKSLAGILPKSKNLHGTNVVSSWANGDSIEKLKGVYKKAQESGAEDKTKEYVKMAVNSLEGLDGSKWVKYADKANTPEYSKAVDYITQAVSKTGKERKSLLKKAQENLSSVTKAENVLKFNSKPQANLEETLRDVADLGAKFNKIKNDTVNKIKTLPDSAEKVNINQKVSEAVDKYSQSLKGFVNKKSLIGLGIVIAIAVSVQTINRAITRKQFKAEGAPIYKDFGKKDTRQKMDEKKKKQFFGKKLLAAAGMYGLAALSMMKKPTLGMFQFSGIFPTMDQCRWIASSTFASRMMGAEDENELRETVVRDIASFSGLYFLGDYVKKGAASLIEHASKTKKGAQIFGENVVLLNRKKEITKTLLDKSAPLSEKVLNEVKFRAKQFGNWIKNTDLKTAAEVSSTKVRNLRNMCRVADIAFSIIMLGVLLPKYNRRVTEKKVELAKKQEREQRKSAYDFSKIQNSQNVPKIFRELT